MEKETAEIADVPADRAVKFNVDGAGNYRVQYDEASWKLLLAELPKLSVPDRVNLLSDTWALVQANRAPLSLYLGLVEKMPGKTELAEREQIMTAFAPIGGVLAEEPRGALPEIRHLDSAAELRRTRLGTESRRSAARGCAARQPDHGAREIGRRRNHRRSRERFARYLADRKSLAPDLRLPVLAVVGRYADEATWNKLHELARKSTGIEEKQNYYAALTAATDPKLARTRVADRAHR